MVKPVKKILLFRIPVSICNFRCHYCYIGQRPIHFQGFHPEMRVTPDEFGKAFSDERMGGVCFANFCADGETLLTKDLDLYVKRFCEQGHYAEVVTNLSVTKALDKFLKWDKDLLKHLEFKCSFHYLWLKQHNLLETFADNVNKIWEAGASANIEITPSDELVPYINEVKDFSMEHFGALPHITIARDDRTSNIDYLTHLSMEEYDEAWSQFDSEFWRFKKSIFGVKQKDFCYAGSWSYYIDLATGDTKSCYFGRDFFNFYDKVDGKYPLPPENNPVGKCPIAHCYNGHALLTFGLIPHKYSICYGNIRDRVKTDGLHWLQPELLSFFNTKLEWSYGFCSRVRAHAYYETKRYKRAIKKRLKSL